MMTISLNGSNITGRIFYSQSRSCNFDTILSYLRGLFSDSFQITKRHSCYVYSISFYIHSKFHPIHSSGLPCRCDRPWTSFHAKINHNSVNLNQISTKIGMKMH